MKLTLLIGLHMAIIFYQPSVNAGTHAIKIQWIVSDGTGYLADRKFSVIALPE